jgi:haloalkane dehalogenase
MVTAPTPLELAAVPESLRSEYPFSPHRFRTPSGAVMAYLDEGPRSQEAVVMVHGNPTWSFYYRHLVQALAPSLRCIVPDHIGMGLSEKPPHYDYTLETRIADLEALIDTLGLTRVHLVVHDWGGAIGLGWAGRYAARVGRIVLLNTAAFTSEQIPARIALCKAPLIGPLLVRGANGFAWPATWMAMHRRSLTSTEKRGYLLPYDSWAHRVAVSAFVQDIPMHEAHPTWSTLKGVEANLADLADKGISIVWGGRDFCFNDEFLARWRALLPAASVHRIPDAGHYVLDDAREEVLPLITRFFAARAQ